MSTASRSLLPSFPVVAFGAVLGSPGAWAAVRVVAAAVIKDGLDDPESRWVAPPIHQDLAPDDCSGQFVALAGFDGEYSMHSSAIAIVMHSPPHSARALPLTPGVLGSAQRVKPGIVVGGPDCPDGNQGQQPDEVALSIHNLILSLVGVNSVSGGRPSIPKVAHSAWFTAECSFRQVDGERRWMPIRGVMVDLTAVPGACSWSAYLAHFSPELSAYLAEIADEPRVQCTLSAPTAFLEGCRLVGQVPEEVVFLDPRPERIEAAREAGLLAVLLREPAWDVRFEVESLCYENHPELYLGEMSWRDVDPAGHTLDLERVRQVAEDHIPANPDEYALNSAEFALHHELLAEFGYWIQGWRWTARDSGGPVRAWQDTRSLLYDENEDSSEPPVARVVRAVEQWQSFLIELREAFEPGGDLEQTALRLLPLVVRYTEANDAWYDTFTTVLLWYLEFRGLDPELYKAEIGNTVGGRFQSWCAPMPNESAQVCSVLGTLQGKEPAPVDAMDLWIATRPTQGDDWLTWREPKVARDGHAAFIELEETRRCPERARRMRAALDCSRRWALSGCSLEFSDLHEWSCLILGEASLVRTTPAFAKQGRERYGYPFLDQFLACLSEPEEGALCFRAARAYLDVCFFHPFVDGNARLARLVLDAILWREGRALHRVEPVFSMSRSVTDGVCWHLSSEVNQMLSLRP